MCNIAGYVGERDAAPILLDMMSRETGYGGGYYTGIATLADGRLHWDKVLGDLDLLQKALKGKKLPGHVGIIHSRSNSGGDREWAHPFVSNDETLAYVDSLRKNMPAGGMRSRIPLKNAASSILPDRTPWAVIPVSRTAPACICRKSCAI